MPISAPALNSRSIMSLRSLYAAKCNAVHPISVGVPILAPSRSSVLPSPPKITSFIPLNSAHRSRRPGSTATWLRPCDLWSPPNVTPFISVDPARQSQRPGSTAAQLRPCDHFLTPKRNAVSLFSFRALNFAPSASGNRTTASWQPNEAACRALS